ncbi:MAG: M14 family metallopeptidase [Chitinophagaceae bacterium]|nr:M14 family metallopeptidase [Chitinophagaceae bacterium]
MRKICLFVLSALLIGVAGKSQGNYSDFARQSSRLQELARSHPKYAQLKSLAKTSGNRDIWLLTLGAANADSRPAIAIAGGVEGNNPLSTELVIGFAEELLRDIGSDSVRQLLEKTTFYLFPNMSPDAMEQYFAKLQYERTGNARSTDDDRDGKSDEDGMEDLDGDGKITFMRIASPVGEFLLHPDDNRVLVKADPAKPQVGKYLLMQEGIDNDKDGKWNEDGEGGVAFNKNMSFKHPSFTPGAGEFPISEIENRAMLDFLFERFNVYAVVNFSSHNNLSQPNTFNQAQANAPVISGWQDADVKVNGTVSEVYNKIIKQKDAPKSPNPGGDFQSWAYFHYNRFAFSTPGWWVPKTKPDSTKQEKAFTQEDPVANYLRWAGQNGVENYFTPWKKINHPDFPNQEVEVGGVHPFVMHTPPYQLTKDIVRKHKQFVVELAGMQPELDLLNLKTEKLGQGITRVTVDVANLGLLPSHTKLGERSYWIKRILVTAGLAKGQEIISGRARHTLGALPGQSSETISWLIKGSGILTLEAGSPTTGTKSIKVSL